MIKINEVKSSEIKSTIVIEILTDLEDWFGLEESTKEYIENAKDSVFWKATVNNKDVGFLYIKETSVESIEIHCMGVLRNYHKEGIGTALVETLLAYAKDKYKLVQVKTVDEGYYRQYDKTIKFYQAMGFSKLEVFPTLWDEWNPCLVLVKAIKK